MSLRNVIVKARNIAITVALAVSVNVAGQTKPKVVTASKPSVHVTDTKKNLTHKLSSEKKYYDFDNKSFIIEQYSNIPILDKNKPVYETLLYDTLNKHFCYLYEQNREGLHKAFLKSYTLVTTNGVDDRAPFRNETFLPPIFPDQNSVPRGSVIKYRPVVYSIFNETLVTGNGSIHKWWIVKGDTVESVFNKNEYTIKIHTK